MRLPPSNLQNSRMVAMIGLCALTFVSFSAPARAMDDGDASLFTELTSLLGVDDTKKPEIDYRDRAPLVLPPKNASALPKPQSVNGKPNAAWPNDPDVLRAKKEAAQAKLPTAFDVHRQQDAQDPQARLASRVVRTDQTQPPQTYECNIKHCPPTSEQLTALHKSMSAMSSDQKYKVGEEPPREWLTEPPKGYRKLSENVNGEQAVAEQSNSNPLMFWRRWTSGN